MSDTINNGDNFDSHAVEDLYTGVIIATGDNFYCQGRCDSSNRLMGSLFYRVILNKNHVVKTRERNVTPFFHSSAVNNGPTVKERIQKYLNNKK